MGRKQIRSQGQFNQLALAAVFSLLFVGCASQSAQIPQTPTATVELDTPPPTETLNPTIFSTSTATADALATQNAMATMDEYEVLCGEEYLAYSVEQYPIWSNEEWLALGCRYDRNLDLVVQNQDGLKWLVRFADYTDPSYDFERSGLEPLGWSPDGRFLYFTKYLSWSGGGDSQCFVWMDDFGLYRLHLATGTVVTLFATNDFHARMIEFSPTGEYYAINSHGVTITNVATEEIINIEERGVTGISWSPDGRYLAYSVASCGEFLVESSSISVWDSLAKETQLLYSSTDNLLTPYYWITNSLLEFEGEKLIERSTFYTTFRYDLDSDEIVYSATETP